MTNYFYRCIGKGTTNSNGVAHITHDCEGNALSNNGYKGVGAGLMDFIASTDSPANISDGSFQSETYELLDCLQYDQATTGNKDTHWGTPSNCSVSDPTSTGTTVSASTQGSTGRYISSISLTGDFIVELQVLFNGKTSRLGFRDGTSDVIVTSQNHTEEKYYQIRRLNGTIEYRSSSDGSTWGNWATGGTNSNSIKFEFMLPVSSSDTWSLTYRNLKIYPV